MSSLLLNWPPADVLAPFVERTDRKKRYGKTFQVTENLYQGPSSWLAISHSAIDPAYLNQTATRTSSVSKFIHPNRPFHRKACDRTECTRSVISFRSPPHTH